MREKQFVGRASYFKQLNQSLKQHLVLQKQVLPSLRSSFAAGVP
jgi:hypothetical protein